MYTSDTMPNSLLFLNSVSQDSENNDVTKSCECGSTVTALTVSLAVVSALLLAALIAIVLLCCKISKLKNKHKNIVVQARDSANGKQTMFAKHHENKSSSISKSTSLRRPTGIALGIQPSIENADSNPSSARSSADKKVDFDVRPKDENDEDGSQESGSPKEYRKTADRRPTQFVFNASGNDVEDDADENDDSPKEFRKTADRRPTKFVFGNPLESGLYDDNESRKSSSDSEHDKPKVTKESRKSVTFDEHIERIPMQGEDLSPKLEESEVTVVEVGGKEMLPSEIFKEIF